MRTSLLLSFVLASLALAHPRRKSLSFGPILTHAHFNTNPRDAEGSLFRRSGSSTDALDVATDFARSLKAPHGELVLRGDSYTDKATGVSHVFFRQLIDGLVVDGANLHINVHNDKVISYSHSLYQADKRAITDYTGVNLHDDYCADLEERIEGFTQFSAQARPDQVVLDHAVSSDEVDSLYQFHASQCDRLSHISEIKESHLSVGDLSDPRPALLSFMIASSPDENLARSIASNFAHYLERIQLTPTHDFAGRNGPPQMHLDNVPDAVSAVKAHPVYVQIPTQGGVNLELAWKFEVEMKDNWYEVAMSAVEPTRILSVVDWASDADIRPITPKPKDRVSAAYLVHSWGVNDPSESNRTVEKEQFDRLASPIGWHSIPAGNDPSAVNRRYKDSKQLINYTTTFGNNVFAHEDWEGRNNWLDNYRPDAGSNMVFNYTYAPRATNNSADALDEARRYINATVTQLFYTSNMVHDLYYRYGFDEVSGNFQQHNFGRGGEENDAIIANAQDGSGYNNANFMTPPDGQNGRCRMYLWNTATPYRDGDMEAGIVIHEISHGLSTRLTGGPKDSSCLGWGESGGMGEGWGDFLATTIRSTANYSDYAMGAWAANREQGIRNYLYSTNATINPSTYKTLDKPGYWGVHAIGEVWAEILWVTSQKLIEKHGFSNTLFPPAPLENGTVPEGDFYRLRELYVDTPGFRKEKPLVPKHGNTLMTQLVLNGMKLQPCRPSFFEARNAIIQADLVLTDGENYCTLWEGFSEKGLGPDARVDARTPWGGGIRTNDFALPKRCQ